MNRLIEKGKLNTKIYKTNGNEAKMVDVTTIISGNNFQKSFNYLLVSAFVTLVDISLLLIFVEIGKLHYLIATTMAYVIALFTKFILTKYWIFKERIGEVKDQFKRFVSVSLGGMILTNIMMYVGVDLLAYQYVFVKIGVIGIIFAYTGILHNFISFGHRTENTQ